MRNTDLKLNFRLQLVFVNGSSQLESTQYLGVKHVGLKATLLLDDSLWLNTVGVIFYELAVKQDLPRVLACELVEGVLDPQPLRLRVLERHVQGLNP